ncbi:hypothetical protein I317_01009 [Kwoniella heveanensis CBS 569]|nr:hypothetical protein I317_01009 [Kwoniella heveanensis CBS 569]
MPDDIVFRDTLDLPQVINQNNKRPENHISDISPSHRSCDQATIDLDYPTDTIAAFLDLINVSEPHLPPKTYEQAKKLYELCMQYDVRQDIQSLVKARFHEAIGKCPREGLIYAGSREDVELAKVALSCMTTDEFVPKPKYPTSLSKLMTSRKDWIVESGATDCFWSWVSQLPLPWQTCLLRTTMAIPQGDREEGYMRVRRGWKDVAAKFNPDGPVSSLLLKPGDTARLTSPLGPHPVDCLDD